jgi:hypothetical protein
MTSASSFLLDKRLRAIERQLGLEALHGAPQGPVSKRREEDDDVATRLAKFEAMWHEKVATTPRLHATHTDWIESLQKMLELDPGSALTHQQQIAAPILYRRQEVIACADSLSACLERLSTVVSALLIGQGGAAANKAGSGKKDNISASHVMNAPILVEPRVSAEAMARLSSLAESLQLLQERSDKTTHSLDQILRQYHVMVTEIAEKTVIIDAELARRGA